MSNQPTIDELCEAAELYRLFDWKPLPLDGKTPRGVFMSDWANKEYDANAIREKLEHETTTEPGIGVQQGPISGSVDAEFDTAQQYQRLCQIFGGENNIPFGPAFQRPGDAMHGHRLFQYEDWMEQLGTANLFCPCLDDEGNPIPKDVCAPLIIRVGVGPKPGTQSAYPPSKNKVWVEGRSILDCPLPRVTEVAKVALLAIVADKKRPAKSSTKTDASYTDDKADEALEGMLRHKPGDSEQDGSGRLILIARVVVEFNLSPKVALRLVRRYEQVYPFPVDWSDAQILERIKDAETRTARGSAKPRLRKADDIGNGQRFADQHGDNARYSYEWRKWMYWHGGHWKIDTMGGVRRMAKRTARSLFDELARIDDKEIREAMYKWAKASASRDKLGAMLEMAQSEKKIATDYRLFNQHPWLFNCKNGTVDLHTGKLREHRREDNLTTVCPLAYPETYTPPALWLSFLNTIFEGNGDVIEFVQRLMGCSLVGEVVEHVLAVLFGGGANGKTVLVETWRGTMGKDYATCTRPDFLIRSKSERHLTEMASLYGKRLAVSSETDEGARLDEARVKLLTGGGELVARRMREDEWSFKPSHLQVLDTNYKPIINGTEFAIWRRIMLLPFNVTIPDAEQDKDLINKLRAERPMILHWMVRGCLQWQQLGGLCPPAIVTDASREYRETSDSFGEFVAEQCTKGAGKVVRAGDLYEAYSLWMKNRGQQPVSMRRLGERLGKEYAHGKDEKGKFYNGLSLNWQDVDTQFDPVT